MRDVRIALATGLGVLALAVVLVSLRHPTAVARTNGAVSEAFLATFKSRSRICQEREPVPRGTTAIVGWIGAFTGPRVSVELLAGGRVLASGERAAGWSGRSVTVQLDRPVERAVTATVCFTLVAANEEVLAWQSTTKGLPATTDDGRPLAGTIALEFLRPGRRTWLSQAAPIADHMGLGRVPSGGWAPLLVLVLFGALVVVASGAVLDRSR